MRLKLRGNVALFPAFVLVSGEIGALHILVEGGAIDDFGGDVGIGFGAETEDFFIVAVFCGATIFENFFDNQIFGVQFNCGRFGFAGDDRPTVEHFLMLVDAEKKLIVFGGKML